MPSSIFILDAKGRWKSAIEEAAGRAGYSVTSEPENCLGFIRTSPNPGTLQENQKFYHDHKIDWIQDAAQVDVYEDKVEQTRRWAHWMPKTWLCESQDAAYRALDQVEYPFVSKAKEGSSSRNVKLIHSREEATRLVNLAFSTGFPIYGGTQKSYVLFQEFISHSITYRVNALCKGRAVFYRYCYPGDWMAQTGNVEPAFEMSEEVESLLEYSDKVFENIGTKWCALDILKDGEKWKLLETSLAWPWPSPGRCNEGTIFRTKRRWIEMFDAMFDGL